jgi:hypothetical protein
MFGGSRPGRGWEFFSLPPRPERLWGPLSFQWVPGALYLVVKRPGREADLSPPSSAKAMNVWSYTSTPQYASMAWYSAKRNAGTVYLYLYPLYIKCRVNYTYDQFWLNINDVILDQRSVFIFHLNNAIFWDTEVPIWWIPSIKKRFKFSLLKWKDDADVSFYKIHSYKLLRRHGNRRLHISLAMIAKSFTNLEKIQTTETTWDVNFNIRKEYSNYIHDNLMLLLSCLQRSFTARSAIWIT